MAKCPSCGTTQSLRKIAQMSPTTVIECPNCGASLAIDSKRNKILVGGLAALSLLPLAESIPKGKFMLWLIILAACYSPFYYWAMKFNVVKPQHLELTQQQQADFKAYVKVRQKRNKTALILFIVGIVLVAAALFFRDKQTTGILILVGLVVTTSGMITYVHTRCPFCHKMTTYLPSRFGCRCMYCHRDIDTD